MAELDAEQFARDVASMLETAKPPRRRTRQQKRARLRAARQKRFLAAYIRSGGVIQEAARRSRVRAGCHYEWMAGDRDYRRRFEAAREAAGEVARADARLATKVLEAKAWRLALVGRARKRFHRGEPIIDPDTGRQYVEFEEDSRVLLKLLEANCPEKYRNSLQVVQQTGVEVRQVAGDVAAMAAMIPPPPEAVQAAIRTLIVQEQGAGGNGNGNGKPEDDGKDGKEA